MTDDAPTQDILILNDLASLCMDSARDLRAAADQARHTSLGSIFLERAVDRDRIVQELQSQILTLGGTTNDGARVTAVLGRARLDFHALMGGGVKSAIEEIERREDAVRGRFEQAMYRKDISPAVQRLVSRCGATIREGHDEIWALKHASE